MRVIYLLLLVILVISSANLAAGTTLLQSPTACIETFSPNSFQNIDQNWVGSCPNAFGPLGAIYSTYSMNRPPYVRWTYENLHLPPALEITSVRVFTVPSSSRPLGTVLVRASGDNGNTW